MTNVRTAADVLRAAGGPIAVTVTRFRCPTCPRGFSTRKRAQRHVDNCLRNPENHGCKTCIYYERGEKADYLTGYPGCPESCGNGFTFEGRLRVHCEGWSDQP